MTHTLLALTSIALVACGSVSEGGQGEDPTTKSDEAATSTPDAAPSCEAQRDQICTRLAAQCGTIVDWGCDGKLWDCGRCLDGTTCGDNGEHHSCGRHCNGANYVDECAAAGAPAGYGMSTACVDMPYRLDGAKIAYRPTGRRGCELVNGLLCCP